jgi:hypothetical protein
MLGNFQIQSYHERAGNRDRAGLYRERAGDRDRAKAATAASAALGAARSQSAMGREACRCAEDRGCEERRHGEDPVERASWCYFNGVIFCPVFSEIGFGPEIGNAPCITSSECFSFS